MKQITKWRPKGEHFWTLVIVMAAVGLTLTVIGGYYYGWPWSGLNDYTSPIVQDNQSFERGKTLWDWMQLLIVPLVLAIGGIIYNRSEKKRELAIAEDNQQEAALQSYFDTMSELILDKEKRLRTSKEGDEVRSVARTRTLTTLRRLDSKRKGLVLQFLYDANLITRGEAVVSLRGANFINAQLMNADLENSDLRGAILAKSDLFGAKLSGADLSETILHSAQLALADLTDTNLEGTMLEQADMRGATIKNTNITKSLSIKNATMPDGKKHP